MAADPVTQRDWDDAHLIDATGDPLRRPRVRLPVRRRRAARAGHRVGENRVARLCRARTDRSTRRRSARAAKARAAGPRRPRAAAISRAPGANQVWLTDITEHPTDEGKLYLCAVKDVYSNRIVGYSIDDRMKASLAVAALRNAVALRGGPATIVHSDRGSQFRSRTVPARAQAHKLRGSMGKVATAADNAAMESFFSLLQKNVLDRRRWNTREELRLAIVTWIERTYHRRRRQRALGRLTPIEFEFDFRRSACPGGIISHNHRQPNPGQTQGGPAARGTSAPMAASGISGGATCRRPACG